MTFSLSYDTLSAHFSNAGFPLVKVSCIDSAEYALNAQKLNLSKWQQQGFAADMEYMKKDADLFLSIRRLLPSARSLVSFLVPYHHRVNEALEVPESWLIALEEGTVPEGYGQVARYAWGRDYHRVIKKRSKQLLSSIQEGCGFSFQARSFSDAVPLLERVLAHHSGLGFIGKNSLLLKPGMGSYFFLAEIVVDFKVTDIPEREKKLHLDSTPGAGCRTCTRCLVKCPTNAFKAPGVLDARRCIAYLTIEKKTCYEENEASMIGSWIFGCDVCQQVCPFNHKLIPTTTIKEFHPTNGVGPFLSLKKVFALRNHSDCIKLAAGTPLMRAGREGLIRNALAVSLNTRAFPLLSDILALEYDNSFIVRRSVYDCLAGFLPLLDGLEQRAVNAVFNRLKTQFV